MRPGRASWAVFPAGVWVASRVIALYLGYLSIALVPNGQPEGGSHALYGRPALDALCRQDCGWFDLIARHGYRIPKEANIWPGLPMSARAVAAVTPIPPELALIIIPNLACLGAYLLIYRLFAELDGDAAARWGLVAFVAFPFSFFHSAGYPESLLIFFSALAVALARTRRHVAAGIALGIGVLCRHVTILWGLALVAAQLRERRLRRFFLSPALVGLVMPFLLAGVYVVYCKYRFGDPLAFWHARAYWGVLADWSIGTFLEQARHVPQIISYFVWASLPTVGALWLLRHRRYAELAAAVLPYLAVIWIRGTWGLGRYAAACWPAFLPIGRALTRWPALRAPVLLFLAAPQGWYFFLYSHMYDVF